MPGQDHKPDEFDDAAGRDDSRKEAGEFTSAFGAKVDRATESDPLTEGGLPPAPESLTHVLGGKSKTPSPSPDKIDQPRSPVSNAPESRPADSFTKAFEDVNAFTRNPADLRAFTFSADAGRQPRPDAKPSESSGSFTRLFGSGEGILTPAGEEERPRPGTVRDPAPLAPSQPTEVGSGGFTEAFQSQSALESHESKTQRGSFTEEFGPPTSWPAPEPLPPHKSAPPYPSRPGSTLPGYNVEPVRPSTGQRPSAPAGGFTRLIDPLRSEPVKPEPTPPPDLTQSSMRSPRSPEYPLADSSYPPRDPGSRPGATVVFNPSSQPESEVAAPRGKSEYTMVVERSSLRPPVEVPGAGATPYGAGASAAPPYPQMAPPVAPAWTPPPAPAPPWHPPQLTPPPMPQAAALAAPALPLKPPTLGDKLVSFLPFMLALTVINFLGLLAVLIILFATRK